MAESAPNAFGPAADYAARPALRCGAREATSFLVDQALGFVFPAALRAVAVLGVADHLADGPLAVAELAERACVHEGNLLRVLRVLATRGVVEELDDGRFRLTELGQPLRSDAPLPAGPAIVMLTDRSLWLPTGELERCLQQGGPIFDELFGMPFFTYVAQQESTATAFHNGMAAFPGRERTRTDFEHLFAAAGLRLSTIVPTGTVLSVVEARTA